MSIATENLGKHRFEIKCITDSNIPGLQIGCMWLIEVVNGWSGKYKSLLATYSDVAKEMKGPGVNHLHIYFQGAMSECYICSNRQATQRVVIWTCIYVNLICNIIVGVVSLELTAVISILAIALTGEPCPSIGSSFVWIGCVVGNIIGTKCIGTIDCVSGLGSICVPVIDAAHPKGAKACKTCVSAFDVLMKCEDLWASYSEWLYCCHMVIG